MVIPDTNRLANNTTIVFTTNKNKPSVRMVTGNVRIMRMGFKKIFNKASTTANIKAVTKLFIAIPERKYASPNETAAITSILTRKFIVYNFY